jgi:peptidoglycan hydrolase CwlO-like protein
MPSFSKETLERWRDERVSSSNKDIPEDLSSIKRAIEVAKEDLEEEEYRLRRAKNQLEISEMNIDSLKDRLKKLIKAMQSKLV